MSSRVFPQIALANVATYPLAHATPSALAGGTLLTVTSIRARASALTSVSPSTTRSRRRLERNFKAEALLLKPPVLHPEPAAHLDLSNWLAGVDTMESASNTHHGMAAGAGHQVWPRLGHGRTRPGEWSRRRGFLGRLYAHVEKYESH